MWEEIFKIALENGVWAVLFVGLLIYVVKNTASREKKYEGIILNLAQSLTGLNEVKECAEEIKINVYKIKTDVLKIKENIGEIKSVVYKRINYEF